MSTLHGGEEGEDAEAGGAYGGGAGEGGGAGGVAAPTLRERLRNAASAMNMMRRLGVGVLYPIHDPANAGATNSSQQADLRLGINRSMRAYNLFEEIKKDYQDCYARFPSESAAAECPERDAELQRVHERSARKCLELARTNGGLYTKAAQFVASDASQLLGGLQASLQTLAHASVDHMTVYRDAAAHTAEHAQEAIATSRSFIEKCQQLDERMRAVGQMKEQLHDVEGALTRLEAAILPRHGPGESGGAV